MEAARILVMKLEKLKTEDIVKIAIEASELALKYTPYRQKELDKDSFIEGFVIATDLFRVIGIDVNRLLTNYNKEDLELYLLHKNII